MPEIGRPVSDDIERRELYLPFGADARVLRYRIHNAHAVVIRG